ncbi:DnaJ domain-containing protein [Gilvimarinus sp. F26214L]|uniref:DnaJ domain-containing protein n=1 Tax=Gilvimarinus sp. DZF01 TaxID=3461371 RepID=UPI004045776E
MDPRLRELLARADRRVNVCAAFALLWVASADGGAEEKTRAYLDSCGQSIPGGFEQSDLLLAILAEADSPTFLEVCRLLQKDLDNEEKHALLEMAVATATADHKPGTCANHILRFVADLFGIEQQRLQALHREYCGSGLPEPGDPGSVLWWEMREGRPGREHGTDPPSVNRLSRAEAYAILGVDREAPKTEIKRAYRRLVQNYHPDRFEALGPDARQEAELNFLRVRQAYEDLCR